jgi:hypothetical protein
MHSPSYPQSRNQKADAKENGRNLTKYDKLKNVKNRTPDQETDFQLAKKYLREHGLVNFD